MCDTELKECFILFDPAGNGFIAGSDLGRALRAMGQNPSERDISDIQQKAVLNGEYTDDVVIMCRVDKMHQLT